MRRVRVTKDRLCSEGKKERKSIGNHGGVRTAEKHREMARACREKVENSPQL
jgi:hypothetical protein